MGLLSPTVIRVAAIVFVAGTIAFVVAGFMGQTDDQSTGNVLLAGVVIGGPISAVVGVITGIFWERLFGPIKSVEHLDMRKKHYKSRRRSTHSPEPETDLRLDEDQARAPEPASQRRYTGRGGGKRRR